MVGDENQKKTGVERWSGASEPRVADVQSALRHRSKFNLASSKFSSKLNPGSAQRDAMKLKNGTAETYARKKLGFQVFSQSFLNVRKTPDSGTHNSVQCSTGEFNVQTNQFNAPTSFKVQHDIVQKKVERKLYRVEPLRIGPAGV